MTRMRRTVACTPNTAGAWRLQYCTGPYLPTHTLRADQTDPQRTRHTKRTQRTQRTRPTHNTRTRHNVIRVGSAAHTHRPTQARTDQTRRNGPYMAVSRLWSLSHTHSATSHIPDVTTFGNREKDERHQPERQRRRTNPVSNPSSSFQPSRCSGGAG